MNRNSFSEVKLGDVVDLQTGFPFKSADYTDDLSAPRLLRGDNIIQGNLRWEGVKRWPSSKMNEVEDVYKLEADDVVLAMDRPWIEAGLKYAWVRNEDLPCLLVQRVARLRACKTVDQNFLRYIIGSPSFTSHILAVQTGTSVPHISPGQIKEYTFLCPPLDSQRAIAHLLGALDDKIELNRQMNRTLETMAQALFKSWFVDFDPVTGKAAGRKPYGMNEETAVLFPDRFVDSELGLIPEGWQGGRVTDLANITSGKRPGIRSQAQTPDIKIPLFGGGGVMGYAEEPLFNTPILLTGRVGTLGEIFRVTFPCWASDNTLVLLSKDPRFYEYLYFQLLEIDFQSLNRGSTQPLVTQGDLQKQPLLIPSPEALKAFSSTTSQLFNLCDCNNDESAILATLRDALLPKLLSGEIRVREAGREMEQVV